MCIVIANVTLDSTGHCSNSPIGWAVKPWGLQSSILRFNVDKDYGGAGGRKTENWRCDRRNSPQRSSLNGKPKVEAEVTETKSCFGKRQPESTSITTSETQIRLIQDQLHVNWLIRSSSTGAPALKLLKFENWRSWDAGMQADGDHPSFGHLRFFQSWPWKPKRSDDVLP